MTGLALLAKYTSVLLPLAVVIALLSSPRGRKQFARPWPYVAVLIAILIFSPVLYWNAHHEWVSFRFQLNHGLGSSTDADAETSPGGGILISLAHLGEYIGGQLAVWNPVLMGLGVMAIVRAFRRYRQLDVSRHILIWCSLVPLLFFGAATLKAKGEINWPGDAYLPMSILIIEAVILASTDFVWGMLRLGTGIALFCGLAMGVPWQMARAGVRFSKFDELFGWKQFAERLDQKAPGLPVVVNSQRDAGQIAFNLPGQPQVWVNSVGSRPTAFDFMDPQPEYQAMPAVVFVGGHVDRFCARYGFTVLHRDSVRVKLATGRERVRPITLLTRQPVGMMPAVPATQPSTAPTERIP
jgi:hypothetical protein